MEIEDLIFWTVLTLVWVTIAALAYSIYTDYINRVTPLECQNGCFLMGYDNYEVDGWTTCKCWRYIFVVDLGEVTIVEYIKKGKTQREWVR